MKMIRRILVVAALAAPVAAFAADGATQGAGTATPVPRKADAPPPGTGNTNVNGTQHRFNQKWLRAYCEDQARKQGQTGAKAKAAIAACEKS
jgi:hypothetical protein